MPVKKLETILYFENYVVLDPGDTNLDEKQLLTEEQYRILMEDPEYAGRFRAGIGAEAIRDLLRKIEVDTLAKELREQLKIETSIQKKKKLTKRLKVIESFRKSGSRPEHMIFEVIPVIPPELRPLVPLDGGRFATSDLNDLYRRVINRNNRLKRLQELKAPEVIIRNEKRMLQESVDALFDNGRRGRVLRGSKNRPLKSLSDMLKGKQGRFRQNLLGKRVDYSGRSVIVVGPELKLHQCGLPEKMALELFKPFVFNRLQEKGFATTIKNAQKMVERETPEVWEVLEEVVKEHPVLLNRAPTLHRAGIQAFEPVLVNGKAIRIHPLVCTAFNADFDGDQMAVHVPLSIEAQVEAKILMMATGNLLSPANGGPQALPSQDMILGIYYMTRELPRADVIRYHPSTTDSSQHTMTLSLGDWQPDPASPDSLFSKNSGLLLSQDNGHVIVQDIRDSKIASNGLIIGSVITDINGMPIQRLTDCRRASQLKSFASIDEVVMAYNDKRVKLLDPIRVRIPIRSGGTNGGNHGSDTWPRLKLIETTVGRVLFNQILPSNYAFVNKVMEKKSLARLITDIHLYYGSEVTVTVLDKLKDLGFQYSTLSGLSIGLDDMQVPQKKADLIQQAQQEVTQVYDQYNNGVITNGERYNKVIDIWSKVTEQVAEEMFRELGQSEERGLNIVGQRIFDEYDDERSISRSSAFNPIFMMADSGARGSRQQIRQLAGMRGLMAKPSGEIIETPITANFREGLSVLQYFISTHGARKGLADTALKTADSGYLTRRLVDVSQDVTVVDHDCHSFDGIYVMPIVEGGEVIESLQDRIVGRVVLEDVLHPVTEEVLVHANQLIDEDLAEKIENAGLDRILIRSVLTCQSKQGVCALCYGSNLSTRRLINQGEAVGIIAAQSIGEPGTQLTMRTFHIGGTANVTEQSTLVARRSGTIRFHDIDCVRNRENMFSVRSRGGVVGIVRDDNDLEDHYPPLVYGATLLVNEGDHVEEEQVIAHWDPFTTPLIVEMPGESTVILRDVLEGMTMQEEVDEVTGLTTKVIVDTTDESYQPRFVLKNEEGKTVDQKLIPTGANLQVNDGDRVFAGDIIAKIPRDTTKTKDITGGLPRVVELFEARKPKEQATISEIDGVVRFGEISRGMRKILVRNENGDEREYSIPRGTHINVREGDRVKAGEPLMDGPSNPHDILQVLGAKEVQKYLVDEVQQVYRLQGVNINDKHIEVIVRQMLRRVKITAPGDTLFLMDEYVDKFVFEEENQRVIEEGGEPASGRPLLLGITVASLSTDSFISAASFQETTRVLTESAISGKIDELRGLKENVIVGRLIPAGTGDQNYRRQPIKVTPAFDTLAE
jgi:DNA-directed RNA polymerase subunit beta'